MIRDLSTKIRPSNNNARYTFVFCMSGGIAIALLSCILPSYRGIVALLACAFLVVAVAVYSKYVAVTYYYDLSVDNNGVPVFVIRQVMGNRQSTLCRIDVADIVNVEIESASERRKHKTPFEYRKYVYTPTLMPKKTVRLTVHGRYEKSEIIIENENYAEILKQNAKEARALGFGFYE